MLEVGGTWNEWPVGHVDGRLAVHLLQTNLAMSLQAPHWLYKRLHMMKVDTHTPYFGYSTCKAIILSVVARHSLVERVVRL
jgi:hypothetical protein